MNRLFEAATAQDLPAGDAVSVRPSGLEEEVTALFDQFRGPLLRYLLSLGIAVADAEELVQEVFLALFRHLRAGKPRTSLRGWIFRVGHNLALKHRERASVPAAELDASCAAPDPDPEQQALGNQRYQRLDAVIRALPEQDRACLSLRAEGLRYREIAGILGMSLGAVSLSLSRSLSKLGRADQR